MAKNRLPFEIQLLHDKAVQDFRSQLTKAATNIVTSITVPQNNVQAAVKSIQTILNGPNGIQMFGRDSRINQQQIAAYIKKLTREMNKWLGNQTSHGLKLGFDFSHAQKQIDEQLSKIQASANVGLHVDDTELKVLQDKINTAVNAFTIEINSAKADAVVDKLGTVFASVKDKAKDMPEAVQSAVDGVVAELKRISKHEVAIPDFAAVIEKQRDTVATAMSAVMSQMETLFNQAIKLPDMGLVIKDWPETVSATVDLINEQLNRISEEFKPPQIDGKELSKWTDLIKEPIDKVVADMSSLTDGITISKLEVPNNWFGDVQVAIDLIREQIKQFNDEVITLPSPVISTDWIKDAVDRIDSVKRAFVDLGRMTINGPTLDKAVMDMMQAIASLATQTISNDGLVDFVSKLGDAVGAFNKNEPDTKGITELSNSIKILMADFAGMESVANDFLGGSLQHLVNAIEKLDVRKVSDLRDSFQGVFSSSGTVSPSGDAGTSEVVGKFVEGFAGGFIDALKEAFSDIRKFMYETGNDSQQDNSPKPNSHVDEDTDGPQFAQVITRLDTGNSHLAEIKNFGRGIDAHTKGSGQEACGAGDQDTDTPNFDRVDGKMMQGLRSMGRMEDYLKTIRDNIGNASAQNSSDSVPNPNLNPPTQNNDPILVGEYVEMIQAARNAQRAMSDARKELESIDRSKLTEGAARFTQTAEDARAAFALLDSAMESNQRALDEYQDAIYENTAKYKSGAITLDEFSTKMTNLHDGFVDIQKILSQRVDNSSVNGSKVGQGFHQLRDVIERGGKKIGGLEAVGSAVSRGVVGAEGVVRQMGMAGVSVHPRIRDAISIFGNLTEMASSGAKNQQDKLSGMIDNFSATESEAETILQKIGGLITDVVTDAEGNVYQLGDAVQEIMTNATKRAAELQYLENPDTHKLYTQNEAAEAVKEEATNTLRERMAAGWVDKNGNNVAGQTRTAEINGKIETITAKDDISETVESFSELVSSQIPRLLQRAFRGLSSKILSWLSTKLGPKIAGAVISGVTIGLGVVASVGIEAFMEWWKFASAANDKLLETQREGVKFNNTITIQGIQHQAALQRSMNKAESEMAKQRRTQQDELRKSRFEMNTADLTAQKEIYSIELKRLQAQKDGELMKSRAANVMDVAKSGFEYQNELGAKRTKSEYRKVWYRDLFGIDTADTDSGVLVDSKIMSAVDNQGLMETEEGRLKHRDFRAGELFRINQTRFEEEMTTELEAYQNLADELASLNGSTLPEELKKKIQDIDAQMMVDVKTNGENASSIKFTDMLQMSFDKAVEAKAIQYDERLKQWYYEDNDGNMRFLAWGEEGKLLAEQRFNTLSAENAVLIDINNKRKASLEANRKAYASCLEEAKTAQAIADTYQKTREAQLALAKELRSNLFEKLKGSWDSFSEWNESNATKSATARIHSLGIIHEAQLRDLRLLGNKDAQMALELKQKEELSKLTEETKLQTSHDWAKFQMSQMDHERKLFDLSKSHEMEIFQTSMDAITKESQATIENRKLERALQYKFIDMMLGHLRTNLNTYGKNSYDIDLERKNLRINEKYDVANYTLEKQHNTEMARWESGEDKKILEMVQKQQNEDLAKRQKAELEALEIRQKKEEEMLQWEFKLRIKQIEYEVKYRHQLEQQQRDMEKAGREDWMQAGGDVTKKELELVGKLSVDDLTDDDRQRIADNRKAEYESGVENLRNKVGNSVVNGRDLGGFLKDAFSDEAAKWLSMSEEQVKALSESDKQQYNAFRAFATKDETTGKYVKNEGLNATVSDHAIMKAIENRNVIRFGKEYAQSMSSGLEELVKTRKRLEEEKQANMAPVQERKDKWVADQQAAGTYGQKNTELKNAYIGLQRLIGNAKQWRPSSNGGGHTQSNVLFDSSLNYYQSKLNLSNEFVAKLRDANAEMYGTTGPNNATKDVIALVKGKINTMIHENMASGFYMTDNEGNIGEATNAAAAKNEEVNKKINAVDVKIQEQQDKAADFTRLTEDLAKLGDGETAAIIAQTHLADTHAKEQATYLDGILKALTGSAEAKGYQDVKKEIETLGLNTEQLLANLDQTSAQVIEQLKTDGAVKKEQEKDRKQGDFDTKKKTNEAKKEEEQIRAQAETDRKKRADQARADEIRAKSSAKLRQGEIDADFSIEMFGATSGNDVLHGLLKRNRESAYNSELAQIEAKHRSEKRRLEEGGATEEQRANLESQQESEKAELEKRKKMHDAMASHMSEVGSLRGLVKAEVGSSSGLAETRERIQAAAFGHVQDPAADAIINLDRNQQLQHASLMSLLTLNLPQIAQNLSNGKGGIQIPQTLINALTSRGAGNAATNQFVGLAGGNSPFERQ